MSDFSSLIARAEALIGRLEAVLPHPATAPDFYVDFDETGPYVSSVGESECAT